MENISHQSKYDPLGFDKHYVEAKESKDDSELYDRCFVSPIPGIARSDPKVAFTQVIKDINSISSYLRPRTQINRETIIPRGYVFAIHETGSDFVTIGYGGKSSLISILHRLQIANPRPIEIIAVLQRYSFDDARMLCDTIKSGLIMYQTKNKFWYIIDNCKQKIVAMFTRIDKIETSSVAEEHRPELLRRTPKGKVQDTQVVKHYNADDTSELEQSQHL